MNRLGLILLWLGLSICIGLGVIAICGLVITIIAGGHWLLLIFPFGLLCLLAGAGILSIRENRR